MSLADALDFAKNNGLVTVVAQDANDAVDACLDHLESDAGHGPALSVREVVSLAVRKRLRAGVPLLYGAVVF